MELYLKNTHAEQKNNLPIIQQIIKEVSGFDGVEIKQKHCRVNDYTRIHYVAAFGSPEDNYMVNKMILLSRNLKARTSDVYIDLRK